MVLTIYTFENKYVVYSGSQGCPNLGLAEFVQNGQIGKFRVSIRVWAVRNGPE